VKALHQFTAGFAKGDAISNEALALRGVFRSWGLASDIYSETKRILPELRRDVRDVSVCAAAIRPDDLVLLHLSIGSPVNLAFRDLPCRKAILYHNVTPPAFYERLNPATAWSLEQGLAQVRALAGVAGLNLAVSRFNAGELEAMGYRDVRVFPLVFDPARLRESPDRRVLRELKDGRTTILFVGRVVPNKRIEDVLLAYAHFLKAVDPEARLVLVGSWSGCERYRQVLASQVRRLGLKRVLFMGSVPQAALHAAYAAADLFLCLSEHEGFCIPLLEAMAHGVPVLAYAAAAVPETMDGAGVLVARKDYPELAELMGRLCRDKALREAVKAGQEARVGRYFGRDLAGELAGLLAPWLGERAP
jgi:glycosyltransferase involved in cell wall biosynthesis